MFLCINMKLKARLDEHQSHQIGTVLKRSVYLLLNLLEFIAMMDCDMFTYSVLYTKSSSCTS